MGKWTLSNKKPLNFIKNLSQCMFWKIKYSTFSFDNLDFSTHDELRLRGNSPVSQRLFKTNVSQLVKPMYWDLWLIVIMSVPLEELQLQEEVNGKIRTIQALVTT